MDIDFVKVFEDWDSATFTKKQKIDSVTELKWKKIYRKDPVFPKWMQDNIGF